MTTLRQRMLEDLQVRGMSERIQEWLHPALSAQMSWLILVSCVTLVATFPAVQAFGQAKNPIKVDRASRQAQIEKKGALPVARTTYEQLNVARFGPKVVVPASRTIAARTTKPGQARPKSTLVTHGEAPDGFGKQVLWDPDDAGLAVVIFLNAGDDLGVMVSGAKRTDSIEFVSATGIASFSDETKNEDVGAFIGIVAAGANLTAAAFGAPELVPLISAGAKFAESRFHKEKVKTYRRDPFGEDPGTGVKARGEGGVIVSLPQARQIFYSGNSDHQERRIKEPGTRDDAHRPDHVKGAFFLTPRGDKRVAREDGDFIIAPWDWKHDDNFGFYRLHVLLKRGSGTFPNPVVDRKK